MTNTATDVLAASSERKKIFAGLNFVFLFFNKASITKMFPMMTMKMVAEKRLIH